jgi:arylsulfatase A-like enzyme
VRPVAALLSRRDFLRGAAAGGLSLAGLRCARAEPFRGPPNLILIVADDLGYECLGCNGGTSYRTPRIDRLAAEGLRFSEAYATPLCTPSRVQLMSGQYPFRNGWVDGIWELPWRLQAVDPGLIDLAARLRSAGYATAVAGKWQLCQFNDYPDHAAETGFDEHFVWTWDYRTPGPNRGRPSRYWAPGIWHDGRFAREHQRSDVFGPDLFTQFVIDFVRRQRERRFFAYYPMVLPHVPVVPTPENKDDFARHGDDVWMFGEMIRYMDLLVGRIADAVDELGLASQTLLLFTADNGTDAEFSSKLGDLEVQGGKETMSSAGGHVPLVARWKGATPAGALCEDLTDSTDLLPTFAELTGAPLPTDRIVDGRSLAPQLRGQPGSPRAWVHLQLRDERALRTRRWKLFQDGRLYDLRADPLEQRPIAPGDGDAEAREARARLERVFAELA